MKNSFLFLNNNNQVEFIKILKTIHSDFFSYNFTKETFNMFRKYLDIKDEISFILFVDDLPAGVFLGSMRGKRGYISSMIVIKEFRGCGLGRLILQKGLSLFKEKHCTEIELEVLQDNLCAINLYKSQGFTISNDILNYKNEKNSFFMDNFLDYKVEQANTFTFQPLYRMFCKEKRSWFKNLKSLVSLLDDYAKQLYLFKKNNQILGFAIISREYNVLRFYDIFLKNQYLQAFPVFLSLLLKDEKVINLRGFYKNDDICNIIEQNGFFCDMKQFEMVKTC